MGIAGIGRREVLGGLSLAVISPSFSAAAAPDSSPLLRPLGPGFIDFRLGFIVVHTGAAADIRMPTADAARAQAERTARARARTMIEAALAACNDPAVKSAAPSDRKKALSDLKTLRIEYQSNGGVLLQLALDLAVLLGVPSLECEHEDKTSAAHERAHAAEAPVLLFVPRIRLALRPSVLVADRLLKVGLATFKKVDRAPAEGGVLLGRVDAKGRLIVDKGPKGPIRRLLISAQAFE